MSGLGLLLLLWAWAKSKEGSAPSHADASAYHALPMHTEEPPLVFTSASPGLPTATHSPVATTSKPPSARPPVKPPAAITATPVTKPPTAADQAAAVLPAPWPAATPMDLPPFPGSGWTYDNPPPLAVQARAKQLLSQLWATGKGSHVTEKTGDRWISYLAEPLKPSGKKAVTAWRLKSAVKANA